MFRRVIACALFLPGLLVAAQQTDHPRSCTSQDEKVYQVGVGNVTSPKLIKPNSIEPPVMINGPIQVELLINSEGRICSINYLNKIDNNSRSTLSEHMVVYWKFTPATHDRKPVSAFVNVTIKNRDGRIIPEIQASTTPADR
jgi:hypothetical protein